MRTERELKFKNIRNIRDFRGLVAEDGKVLKPGRIIRSGYLGSPSEKEIEKLKSEYELKKVIDLRTDLENSEKPDPQTSGLQIISKPVFSASVLGITHENINDKEAVLKNARIVIGRSYAELESQYNGLYTYNENIYRSDRLVKVTKVWGDYFKGIFKNTDYTLWYWILLSIIVDIAAFAFFDIAFKKEDY